MRAEPRASTARRGNGAESLVAPTPFAAPEEVLVGKDILQLLSSGMYVDPMTVYREYVQNAADAVDEARRQGLLAADETGQVDILIDPAARGIRIRDSGAGIAWQDFAARLVALGASIKRGTAARGFRGVGRLAGLAYAQELIFRSRTADEALVSELRWDCRKLRAAFRSPDIDVGVANVIRHAVAAGRVDPGNYPERFFEVELRGVIRLRSDKLMNPGAVAEYLGQVAPVPFSPEFRFGAEITAALRAAAAGLGELDVRVTGVEGPVHRPHRDTFALDDRHSAKFEEIELIEVPGIDGGVAGIGWVLHHDYEGAVPASALVKGLRLRAGNLQVGDHALLEELFPEPRFNSWAVGEVHVLDRRIVTNGRRDNFEQNAHLHNLLNHLAPIARAIARRCRTSSIRRKWLREFELHRRAVEEKVGIIAQGGVAAAQCQALALAAEQGLMRMRKVAGSDALLADGPEELGLVVQSLEAELARALRDQAATGSPLVHLPAEKRRMYEHLFELIYDCSANRTAAKALVDRILLKIKDRDV